MATSDERLMVCILTSSKLEYFRESLRSVRRQQPANIAWDLFIVVNTLNEDYYETILREFPNENIVRTQSNGRSGRGHNSVLDFFQQREEYDYLFMLDGDDFLYPSALRHVGSYIQSDRPEVLMLMYHDSLADMVRDKKAPHFLIGNSCYWFYNFKATCLKAWFKQKGVNPFKNPIYKLNTMGRLILFSRESLKYGIRYDENCLLYDDYYPSMQVLELAYAGKNVVRTDDSLIYLYNRINDTSQTKRFFSNQKLLEVEEKTFRKSIAGKFESIQDWDLSRMTYRTIHKDPAFSFSEKHSYVSELVSRIAPEGRLEENLEDVKRFADFINENGLSEEYSFVLDYYKAKTEKS